jgi:uncharacterized protein (DUF488 family)
MPYSKYTPQYNKEDLKNSLTSHGIYYIFMGNEFGARREDKSLYTEEGFLDFDKVSKTSLFGAGVERIKNGIKNKYSIAFMCTEKDPIDCHRNIMVAREFHKMKYSIYNILENGEVQTQKDIEKRLLDIYFPDRMQPTLFDTDVKDDADLINQAYMLRNRDIGYSLSGEKEVLTS